jgi:transcriptional regulator with XRE-family HTH domain
LTNIEAGERFKEVVHVALARSPKVHTMAELIRCTGLHQNTIYDIFNGEVKDGPGPKTVNRIADCLDIPTRHLWDAWQGREPEPDSAEEALRRHAEAVDAQNRLLGELVGFIRSAAAAVVEPPNAEAELAEGQARGKAADEALRSSEDSGSHTKPPAPHGSAGSGR